MTNESVNEQLLYTPSLIIRSKGQHVRKWLRYYAILKNFFSKTKTEDFSYQFRMKEKDYKSHPNYLKHNQEQLSQVNKNDHNGTI